MQRRGRKVGFALGAVLGMVGGLVGCAALFNEHFALLCMGAVGIGAVNGFSTYYRFAAAEVVDESRRSRAISLVMAGGIVAAVAGSNLASWSRGLFPEHLFAGSYLAIAGIQRAGALRAVICALSGSICGRECRRRPVAA